MTSTKFTLRNLNCDACGKISQLKIKKITGVIDVRIQQKGAEAAGEIEADRIVPIAEIQEALSGTPYKAFTA